MSKVRIKGNELPGIIRIFNTPLDNFNVTASFKLKKIRNAKILSEEVKTLSEVVTAETKKYIEEIEDVYKEYAVKDDNGKPLVVEGMHHSFFGGLVSFPAYDIPKERAESVDKTIIRLNENEYKETLESIDKLLEDEIEIPGATMFKMSDLDGIKDSTKPFLPENLILALDPFIL